MAFDFELFLQTAKAIFKSLKHWKRAENEDIFITQKHDFGVSLFGKLLRYQKPDNKR